jgi:hypothetical protein
MLYKLNVNNDKLRLVQKLYIWSLIFEPLLYFIKASGGLNSGIPISISRVLQICVIFYFLFVSNDLKNHLKSYKTFPFRVSRYYIYYFTITFISTFLGFVFMDSFDFNNLKNEELLPFFKKPFPRISIDFFLLMYYYFYFIILSRIVFNSLDSIKYFTNYFFKVLYIVIFIGFIDYFLAFFQFDLISRHIGEVTDVGTRWHSVLGEPRDAFVFLVYAIFITLINNYFSIQNNFKIIYLLLFALILTQSSSGIIGIFIGLGLFMLYSLINKKRNTLIILLFSFILFFLIFKLATNSDRVLLYIDAFSRLIQFLESGVELPYLLLVQAQNFYPIWGMYIDLINYNFYPILFGSGISSSSFYNFNILGEFANSNAQITRVIFESGLFGLLFYILFLISPALSLFKDFSLAKRNKLFFSFFLVIGCSLSHRTLIPLILYGLLMSFMRFRNEFKFS